MKANPAFKAYVVSTSGSTSNLRANKVYPRRTHTVAQWTLATELVLRQRAERETQQASPTKLQVQAIARLRKEAGVLRTGRVRAATTMWKVDGFAINISRLHDTELQILVDWPTHNSNLLNIMLLMTTVRRLKQNRRQQRVAQLGPATPRTSPTS